MESSEFEELCEKTFTEIFSRAKTTNEISFLTSCFVFHKKWNHNILTYSSDREFQEVLELISDIKGLQESGSVNKTTKARMYLLIYSHILEVDLIYLILYNMINTIRKKEYSPVVKFLNDKEQWKKAKYPSQKIKSLQSISHKIDINVENLYNNFFDKNLRNAFSHSQYYLDLSGNLINTKNIISTSSKVSNADKVQTMYAFEDLESKFEMSKAYVKSFIKIYKKSIEPYMDGESHETFFGPIEFDSKYGWAFTRN